MFCRFVVWIKGTLPFFLVEHFATGGFTMAVGKPHTEFFRKSKTGLAISQFAKAFF